jgi:hypothetical protein
MSASVLIEAVEAAGFGGGGMVAPAFGDVQVVGVFEGRDDGADGGQVGGPLPLGETAGTRAAQVAADARLEETGMLRRTIGAGPTGSRSSPLC